MRLLLVICSLLQVVLLSAQSAVTGRVVDARTQEALAFVPINLAGTNQGAVSDIDGRFRLVVPGYPARIRLSYVGYTTLEVEITDAAPVVLRLSQANLELKPVTVSGKDNPAHRIIRRAYAQRKENDGMRYRSYRYTSYSKTVFDMQLDSAIANDTARMAKLDTSTLKAMEFSEKQHLFMVESATKKSFIPPASAREEVLAMRVSGLKDPSMLALIAQTETFSIYDGDIGIGDKIYLGPLAPSSTSKYRFNLEDTLYQGKDSVYVISYSPRSGTKFNALKGLLYIHTEGYAVQNVTAEPVERDGTSVRFQQLHERVEGKWFPKQLNYFIYLDGASVNGLAIYGVGRTYLKDIEVDAVIARKEVRGPEFVADRMETTRSDDYWKQWRVDTLDQRDLKTYAVIDSIGETERFDKWMKVADAVFQGRIPLGPVDLPLFRVSPYNGYEGIRLGAALETNDRISRYGRLGGYFGYGFKDEEWKYGGNLTLKPWYGRETHLRFSYENDVAETGGVAFAGKGGSLLSAMATGDQESWRLIYVDRMDRIERYAVRAMARVGSSLRLWAGTERTRRMNVMGYRFEEPVAEGVTRLSNDFLIGAVTADLRWAFREKIARLPHREISLGSKYPVLHIQAMRAVKGLWEGEWDTWRVSAMIEKSFRIRLLGNLSVRALAGIADPDAPMPFLFNLRGTNAPDEVLLIAAENTFETMRPNEFLADRYATLHVRHSFGHLLFKWKKFRPVPAVLTSVAVGSLETPGHHRGLSFRAMEHAYIESGVRIDNLLPLGITGLGAGVFYRYGSWSLPEQADNFAFKLSMSFQLD